MLYDADVNGILKKSLKIPKG